MDFELVGQIRDIQPIAVGRAIRELARLRKRYGSERWRKLKESLGCASLTEQFILLRYIGTKLTVSDARSSRGEIR
jgi:hypothetical protein